MRGPRLLLDWFVIAALATLIVLAFGLTGLTERLDNLVYDRLISLRAPPPNDKIFIVAIDNRSLAELGKWPWSRQTHIQLLNQLAKTRPKAIAYDVLFTEPSADDAALAAALTKAAPVYLPLLLDAPSAQNRGYGTVEPVPLLRAAAASIGHVNVHFDGDGLVRRADVALRTENRDVLHVMQLMAERNAANPVQIPILFQPKTETFRTASFVDVMRGEVPALFLRDKYVIIGATGDGMGDQFPVPLPGGGLMSGVDLQANMLNTMLSRLRVEQVPRWIACGAALLPLWILLLGLWRWRPTALLALSLGLITTAVLGCVVLFIGTGWWLPPAPALLALVFVCPVWGWRRLAALSASVEHETARFGLARTAAPSRFSGADHIADRVDDMRAAMQHSRDLRDQAQEREAALQMLSHDMRAPQASIITLLESESKELAPALRSRLTGYARRTLALADNFVQLARVNETSFSPEEVNLSDLASEAIDELYPIYAARKILVFGTGLGEPNYIMAEPGLLIRVLLNLLDNAIKYSSDGGTVECAVQYEGRYVRLKITDQGSGMSAAQAAGLFTRFGSIGGKRLAGASGAGLGLTLVKSAMERHGGTVDCSSAPGAGSCFTLRFPAVDIASADVIHSSV